MKKLGKYKYPYLFILPFILLFLVFQLVPMVWTVVLSFTEWNGLGDPKPVGAANYKGLLKDSMFWDAIRNTFVYWVSGVVLILGLALLIATLLNAKQLRAKSFFKTATFLPNICSAIAMGLIFRMLFDERVGLINEVLASIGLGRVGWLTTSAWSTVPVIILNVWRNTPWFTMILFSGLLNIPEEYYEAARVDGANTLQQFFTITLPSLGNILFFCTITLTVDCWKIFNESYILPGPGTSNTSLFQYMYESGFNIFKMGYAAAIGCVLMLILLLFSVVQVVIRHKQGEL